MLADSFITFPRLPVIVSAPLPFERLASIKRIAPPTEVQARPVTTPGIAFDSLRSFTYRLEPIIS